MGRFDDPKHFEWSKKVKEKDGFSCQICKKIGIRLHSHHMNSYDIFKDDRFLVENGVTLCEDHHNLFHKIFGSGKNTIIQYSQFLEIVKLIHKNVKKG
jgi:hypothetical protein